MADVVFNSFKLKVANGNIDLDTDTFKLMLVTSSYTPNQDTHAFRSDVTNEVSGTGYTTGGATITGITFTQDNTNNWALWDANAVTWSSSTITARGGVVYKSRGGASSADEIVAYFDFGSDRTSTNGDFVVDWPTGLLTVA